MTLKKREFTPESGSVHTYVNHVVQFFETMQSEAEGREPQKPEVGVLAQGSPGWLGCLFSIAIFLVFVLMLERRCLKMAWLCYVTNTICFRQESFHHVVRMWIFLTIGRELHSSPTMLWLWSNAVLSTVRQPAGKYRLLEDPLLPESRKRKLSHELIPSGSSYLHQWP